MVYKRVAILLTEAPALFELGCATELFALARPEFESWYQAEVVTFSSQALVATGGLLVQAQPVESLDAYDMLVVPCWPTQGERADPVLLLELQKFYHSGRRLLSFCSGAFLLAEAGLLDGVETTTHWRYAELFQQRYPSVGYLEQVLYTYDGQLGCSAGSSAALDLGLEVIRRDFGAQRANQVARRLVISGHRQGGQSQFVETPLLASKNVLSETLDWAIEHLSGSLDVAELAQKAGMSRRSFDRKFRASMGLSANVWLIQQKLNLAKQLLEQHGRSIEQVAELAGFENAITMRHHFRRKLGISPSQYRGQLLHQNDLGA